MEVFWGLFLHYFPLKRCVALYMNKTKGHCANFTNNLNGLVSPEKKVDESCYRISSFCYYLSFERGISSHLNEQEFDFFRILIEIDPVFLERMKIWKNLNRTLTKVKEPSVLLSISWT